MGPLRAHLLRRRRHRPRRRARPGGRPAGRGRRRADRGACAERARELRGVPGRRAHPRHARRAHHLRRKVRPACPAGRPGPPAARDGPPPGRGREAVRSGRHLLQRRPLGRDLRLPGARAGAGPGHPGRRRGTATPSSSTPAPPPAPRSSSSRPRSGTSPAPSSGEVEEAFGAEQKGSSAMPHKRNPVLAERLCGLARVLRGYLVAGLEDVALWHERDISHSSVERIVLPDATALTLLPPAQGAPISSRGWSSTPTGRSRTCCPARSASSSASRCSWRWWRPGSPVTRPTGSSSATPGRPGSRVGRSSECWPRTTEVALGAAELDGAFDLSHLLRHADRALVGPRRAGRAGARDAGAGAAALGQGPRPLRRRRRAPAHGGLGPGQRLRRRLRRADPAEGPGAHRDDRVLVRGAGRRRRHRPRHRRPGRDRAGCVAGAEELGDAGRPGGPHARGRHAAARVHRPRLPGRPGLRGVRAARAPSTRTPMPAGLRLADRLPEPMFTPSTKAGGRPRREHRLRPRRRRSWEARRPPRWRDDLPRPLRAGGRPGRRGRARPGRHQVRARPRSTAGSCSATRSSPRTPRGCGPPTRWSRARRRPPSTSSRCATGPPPSPGTSTRPRPPLPAEVVAATSTPLRRRLRAGRRAARSPTGTVPREWRPAETYDEVRGPRRGPAAARHRRPRERHHRAGPARPRLRRRLPHDEPAARSASRSRPRPSEAAARAGQQPWPHRLLANPVMEDVAGRPARAVPALHERPGSGSSSSPGPTASTTWPPSSGGARRPSRAALARRSGPRRRRRGRAPRAGSPTATTSAPGRIARFSPVMGAVAAFAARRRPGGRDLQRVPGADRGRAAARRAAEEPRTCASCARRPWSGSPPIARC